MPTATEKKPAALKVRDLMAMLADCDPDGVVEIEIPTLMSDSDQAVIARPGDYESQTLLSCCVPDVRRSFLNLSPIDDNTAVDDSGRSHEGAKPNCVTIGLAESDYLVFYNDRLEAIRHTPEAEPDEGDADTVILDLAMPRDHYHAIRRVLRGVNDSHQVREAQACTHGPLTVTTLLTMLAEDVAMLDSRPGSWEAAHMAQVLAGHGYG